ncbi:MAG: nucleotide-binding protein [Candidatus Thorarchaeota archaeon]|nr:MAG: nucleotide-binding protein [Candidatus Thorarchaeota archaeon]
MQKSERLVGSVSSLIQVVLDTNFLTVPSEFGVDIFQESERLLERRIEFVVLDSVLAELDVKASKAKGAIEGRKFRVAKDLAKRCKLIDTTHFEEKKSVDERLLEYTESVGGVLATNDRDLKQKARSLGLPVLILRAKKKLSLEGAVI